MSGAVDAPVDAATDARWRPRYHVCGERNWINDPNGPIHHGGRYHLFFQAHEEAPFWGRPSWGHVSSEDLATWARHPVALRPQPGGPDADGCWSGCARVVDGRPAIYYTGVVGEDDERVESVCRAWGSDDLTRWERDRGNPLVAGPPPGRATGYHRDPFLWRDEVGWHMLLGSGTGDRDRHGQVLRYDSADATRWRYAGVFFERPRFCDALDVGEHWECPQLLRVGDAAALVVSCQVPDGERPLMHSVCFTGAVRDGRFDGRFDGRLDFGDVFYAPAVLQDEAGRHLLWGWAQERLGPDRQATLSHAGALTLPRELTLDGDRLIARPAPELEALRAAPLAAGAADGELIATPQMELAATVDGISGAGGWALAADDDPELRAAFLVDLDHRRLDVSIADGTGEPRTFHAPLTADAAHPLRVFVDGSLIEVFAGDGGAVVTTRGYLRTGAWSRARLETVGDAQASRPTAWRLRNDVIGQPLNMEGARP
jgi:beta-fructofuranosidase